MEKSATSRCLFHFAPAFAYSQPVDGLSHLRNPSATQIVMMGIAGAQPILRAPTCRSPVFRDSRGQRTEHPTACQWRNGIRMNLEPSAVGSPRLRGRTSSATLMHHRYDSMASLHVSA